MPARTLRLVLSIALLLLAQGAARAAPLQWEGTFSLELLAGSPSYRVEGGGVASVNASSGALPAHLETLRLAGSRHDLSLAETGLLTDPDVVSWSRPLVLTASLGTGTFSALSGGASTEPPGVRRLPLRGVFRAEWLIPTIDYPLPNTAPLTRLTVNGATAGVGAGVGYVSQNTYTVWLTTVFFAHYPISTTIPWRLTIPVDEIRWVSVQGAPWTIKTAAARAVDPPIFTWLTKYPPPTAIVTATRRGFAHGPLSATTSTAQPGGMLQMVTPMQIRVDHWRVNSGSDRRYGWAVGGFGVLTLRFVPEPGVGALLAAGIAGLVAIGRQRRRK